MTGDLFKTDQHEPEVITLPGADMLFWQHFFSPSESQQWYEKIFHAVHWEQKKIFMYGKEVEIPRLSAWYADRNKNYTYSGKLHEPLEWTVELLALKSMIERRTGNEFNSVLCNLYRDGNDAVAWHSDDEIELGVNPIVASLSFGEQRFFQFRRIGDFKQKYKLCLPSGSLLLMQGETQHNWQHQIAKSTKKIQARINLTFRYIK